MPCQRAGACTRCSEVLKVRTSGVRDSESFRRGRTTHVSSADEQNVDSQLLALMWDCSLSGIQYRDHILALQGRTALTLLTTPQVCVSIAELED